jgi:hypothetical protein
VSAVGWQQQQHQPAGSRDLFDLVVVDEAGQGLGPEVLLPLSLARSKVCVVCAAVVVIQCMLGWLLIV